MMCWTISYQKEVDKVNPNAGKKEQEGRNHESSMMDKKIELEKIKSKKSTASASKKPAAKKKKTVAEEAKDLGLVYVGAGRYADSSHGRVTHLNENGILVPFIYEE